MSTDGRQLDHREPRRFLSARALLLGCLMCAVCGVMGPYWTFWLRSSRMFADYHTGGASFILLVLLVIFNFGLGRLWKPLALRVEELMVVGAMMLVGGSIVTSGLIAYFIPSITAPYNLANPTNEWNQILWPNLPGWLSPLDPNGGTFAIKKFWRGLPAGEPIPWGPWVGPLLKWGIFFLAFFACMMAIMVIMRKQWVDYEHLSFPIAQVPAELCAAGQGGPVRTILNSTAFWLGVGATFVLASSGALGTYFGVFPFFRIRQWIDFTEDQVWRLPIYIDLVVMGLVFLIPNRVAFTVWFVALASWVVRTFLNAYNLQLMHGSIYGGEMNHLAMGATLVFVVSSVWLSRGHLKRVLKCAFRLGDRDYDAGEPASYLTAVAMGVLGLAVSVWWMWQAGLSLVYAALLLLITLAVYYAMARVVAQCGLPALSPPISPCMFLSSLVGTANLTNQQVTVMAMNYGWHFDIRNSPMSGSAHGMYLTKRRRGGLLWAMLLSLMIAYGAAALTTVWVCYRHGGTHMDGWFFGTFPKNTVWPWAQNAINNQELASFGRMVWAGAGAVLMALLTLAQRSFFWWPLHPVGLLIASSHMVYFFWASVFLAWLIKFLLVSVGGYGAYRVGRRFFIGMVMGYFIAGGFWGIIDTITGTVGDAVFYI